MKTIKTTGLLALCTLFIMSINVSAQKLKIKDDLSFLKDVETLDLEFSYEDMGVGKYDSEDDYLNERVEKRNKDEAGSGDKWREEWFNDREERFEPKFEELFNKYTEEEGLKAGRGMDDSSIKLLIKTVFTEPGFNVGVMSRPAHIDTELMFIEKESGKTLATMTVSKVPGTGAAGFDYETGFRIQESYAKLGKEVGKYIKKKVF